MMKKFLLLSLSIFIFLSCGKNSLNNNSVKGQRDSTLVYSLSPQRFVFGFIGQNRYSYCPSIVAQDDGTSHVYFCGTLSDIFVDNVYHIQEYANGTRSEAKSVLQPSLEWDSRHTCDPSVIEGQFRMGGVDYKYAMFFLSNPLEYYYNEIGVAFSNDLATNYWIKYPYQIVNKTWNSEGDQLIPPTGKSWGVGQPSAVSLDKKGKVLLTYTKGDIGGTCLLWRELDMSNMESLEIGPAWTMVSNGWYQVDGKTPDFGSNSDFAINLEEDKIVMVRPIRPFDKEYPAFIASSIEVLWMNLSDFMELTGKWTLMYRITREDTGFPRNHNAGISRDSFGHIKNWSTPTIYYTVSEIEPKVQPKPGMFAEWTYHIYKTELKSKYYYYYKK